MTSARLLTGGTVLTCDPQVEPMLAGDVLIVDGRIAAVGHALAPPDGAEQVDASGQIIFPGLVDAHQHIWEHPFALHKPEMGLGEYFAEFAPRAAGAFDPDDLYRASLSAYRASVTSGTTTVFDWCHATNSLDHAAAGLSAMLDSGLRGVFGYGPPIALGYYGSDRGHPEDLESLVDKHGPQPTPLAGIAAALRGPDLAPLDVTERDIARARDMGLKVSMHIGTARKGPGGVQALDGHSLLGDDLQFVHATDSSDQELALIADSGGRLVVPPIAELVMGTGKPPLTRLAARGQSFGLGVDSVLGGPDDMFSQMRAALTLLRWAEWDGIEPPPGSRCSDVLAAATYESARACWLEHEVGSVTPGKYADLVTMRPSRPVTSLAEAYGQVVWNGHAARLESVLIAGVEQL